MTPGYVVDPVKRATIVFLTHSGADSGAEQNLFCAVADGDSLVRE